MDCPTSDAPWRRSFRRRLVAWYHRHARDLPWRRTREPYRVWVSEIMLQQTQVATVVPYFERFMTAFPTVTSLADASEEQVLRHWEGMGYYRRARQMWRAARIIVDQHGGIFPRDPANIRSLPGIGRYTAGAVMSIAFNAREPILEANTTRLFSRLIGYRGSASSRDGQEVLWSFAKNILPHSKVGDFNQATMELGSRICTPREPKCTECPVADLCRANIRGWQSKIPAATRKLAYEDARETCVVVWRRGQVLLRKCAEGERWAGLWDFPRFPVSLDPGEPVVSEVVAGVEKLAGPMVELGERFTTLKHGVTRFRITLECYEATWKRGKALNNVRWIVPTKLGEYPLTMTARKIAKLIGGGMQRVNREGPTQGRKVLGKHYTNRRRS